MTAEQVRSLDLGIEPIDSRTVLIVESGFEWVLDNTTLEFDINDEEELKALPACAKLFVSKFADINLLDVGVSSESIEGLSQSFDTSDRSSLIWQQAEELLYKYLKSRIQFIPAEKRYIY